MPQDRVALLRSRPLGGVEVQENSSGFLVLFGYPTVSLIHQSSGIQARLPMLEETAWILEAFVAGLREQIAAS